MQLYSAVFLCGETQQCKAGTWMRPPPFFKIRRHIHTDIPVALISNYHTLTLTPVDALGTI